MATSEHAPEDANTRFEGYSDYQQVSKSIAQSVDNAMEAYAWAQSVDVESVGGDDVNVSLAQARADILSAALKLYPEMQVEHHKGNHEYDEFLHRWGWDPADSELDVDGEPEVLFLPEFNELSLWGGVPDWMLDFVMDIRTVGIKLGYLRAGRRERLPDDDPVQAEAEHMLKGR